MRASRSSGFTLLEVLVAIAILGLGMTAILSAQTGLFASSSYAERVSLASGLVRCKLSELELKLNKEGYPLTDMKDEGNCCNDESPPAGYKCKWKIEKIEMPLPPTSTELSNQMSSAMGPGGLGALGAIASVGQSNGSILGQGSGLGDVSKLLAGQAPGGIPGGSMPPGGTFGGGIPGGSPSPADSNSFGSTAFGSSSFGSSSFGQKVAGTVPIGSGQVDQGLGGPPMGGGISSLVPMVMSMVYPTLKPMLEASIRKLTVSVEWQGGGKGKSLDIVEFVTNPMQGGLDPNAAGGLDSAFSAISGLLGGAAPGGLGAGTTGATGAAAPSLLGGSR